MYPILIGCVLALTLLLERAFFFVQTASGLSRRNREFFEKLQREEQQALESLRPKRRLIDRLFGAALENREQPVERIEEKMEAVLVRELPRYSHNLDLLATLAALMPILGLLGTVTGMISTFHVIALKGTGDAQAMAGGISEALITTQAGLVTAVPIIVGHSILVGRLKKITHQTRDACMRLLDHLKDSAHA
jgi:biopolymer transport protein ExbB